MEQFTVTRAGATKDEQFLAAALVQHMNLMMQDIGDIQTVSPDGDIDRAELAFLAIGGNKAILRVINEYLIAPGIRDVARTIRVDANVDWPFHAPATAAGHELKFLLSQIEYGNPAGARVGHEDLAIAHGNSVRLRQTMLFAFFAENEVGELIPLGSQILFTRNAGEILDAGGVW